MRRENLLFVIDSDDTQIREIDLNSFRRDKVTFGRGTENQIVLRSQLVGRRPHGTFEFMNGEVYIYDNGSTNGITVNRRQLRSGISGESYVAKLHDGDVIRIDNPANHALGVMMLFRTKRTPGSWQRVPVMSAQQPITIGRNPNNTVVLESVNVSRRHAIVRYANGGYVIEDQNSANGIFVNGRRVEGFAPVEEKDVIVIAGTVMFFANGALVYKSLMDGTKVVMQSISRTVSEKGRKKYILQNVNLTVEPNEFIAIIGGSGAGKSTVMNAMSGFEQATQGRVLVNDVDLYKNYQVLKNMIGYVPQSDIIYENITLSKMLEYSAKMRMPEDISAGERQKRIGEVLKMVELEEHKDKFIRSLSGGQRKRASIAVELLADPGLFFLDEPTSGLDPGTEESLMKTLNVLSKQKGKTIIMVTHTTQNLHLCDKILFMGKGGKVCFYGTPNECLSFFDVDNLTEIYNKVLRDDEVEYWSQKYNREFAAASDFSSQASKNIINRKPSSFLRQLGILSARYMTLIKNDMQRLLMVFLQPVLITVLLTLVASDDVFDIYSSTKSIMFALSCAGIWMGLFNSIQEVCKERNILKREYMANLRLGAYVLSKFTVQFLLSVIQAFIMVGLFSLFVGTPEEGALIAQPFWEMLATMILTIFSSAALGLVVSSVSKNSDKAMTTAPFLLIIQLLFSGILFDLEGITEKISYLTVSRWSVSAFGAASDLNALPLTGGMAHDAEEIFDHTAGNVLTSWSILGGFILICLILCAVLLRNVSKDSR